MIIRVWRAGRRGPFIEENSQSPWPPGSPRCRWRYSGFQSFGWRNLDTDGVSCYTSLFGVDVDAGGYDRPDFPLRSFGLAGLPEFIVPSLSRATAIFSIIRIEKSSFLSKCFPPFSGLTEIYA